jgi:hypothetical protein
VERRTLSRGSVEAAAVAGSVDSECKKRTTISESLDGVQVEKLTSQVEHYHQPQQGEQGRDGVKGQYFVENNFGQIE